jgi:hypothetical protein
MTSISLKAANGETIYDQSQCVGLLEKHFNKLLNSDPTDCIDQGLVAAAVEATPAPDGVEFSPEEIKSAVRKLKNNKAAGTCGIASELLLKPTRCSGYCVGILLQRSQVHILPKSMIL